MPDFVAQCLFQGLAESDADIFHRVMLIDVQIALRLHVQIDRRVLGQQREHVIEETDAGGNLAVARSRRDSTQREFRFQQSCDRWWRCGAW